MDFFFFPRYFWPMSAFFSHFNRVSVNNRSLRIEPPHRTASYRKKEKKKNQLKLLSAHLGLNNTFWGLLYLDRVLWSDKSWYEEEKSLSGHRARVWCFTGTPRTHIGKLRLPVPTWTGRGRAEGSGWNPGVGGLGRWSRRGSWGASSMETQLAWTRFSSVDKQEASWCRSPAHLQPSLSSLFINSVDEKPGFTIIR